MKTCKTNKTDLASILTDCDYKNINISDEIGKGSYGVVYKGTYEIKKTINVALKMVEIDPDKENAEDDFYQEISLSLLMSKYSIGPNVYKVFKTDSHKGIIIMDYFPFSFDKVLLMNDIPDYHDTIIKLINKAIDLLYIQIFDLNVFCSDIKPENFVVTSDYSDIKMIDFGSDWCTKNLKYKSMLYYFITLLIQFMFMIIRKTDDMNFFVPFFKNDLFMNYNNQDYINELKDNIFVIIPKKANIHRYYLNYALYKDYDYKDSNEYTDMIILILNKTYEDLQNQKLI